MTDKILVVEDSALLTKVLGHFVDTRLRVKAVMTQNFTGTKALLESQKPDFLAAVLDLNLPDAPNGEVVDLVMSYGIPVIVLTSTFDERKRTEILESGAVDYVTKESRSSYEYVMRLIHRLDANRAVKALVVDDGMVDRRFVRMLLELQNFNVLEANNGRQAMEVIAEHPDIRVVITDFNMPELDGFELVTELRKKFDIHELIIIGLSSVDSKNISARFLKIGANDFLPKPFSHEEFFVRIMQNIEAQEHVAKITHAAERDYLTNLYNRRSFHDRVHQILKTKPDIESSIAILDLDHFKNVNDEHGHDAGDQVIINIANILLDMEAIGIPARLGGEEFAIFLPDTNTKSALDLLDSMRSRVETSTVNFNGVNINYSVSIGIAPVEKNDLRSAMSYADKALYHAKTTGRNRCHCHSFGR